MTDSLPTDEQITRRVLAEVAQELREHPERWCQRTVARSASGEGVRWDDPAATQWCVHGHIRKRVPLTFTAGGVIIDKLWDALGESLYEWHDSPDRTVGDVIALCEKVANG
jgi:hypothetical protein